MKASKSITAGTCSRASTAAVGSKFCNSRAGATDKQPSVAVPFGVHVEPTDRQ